MKIDLDWIQKELDAGRDVELECVDKYGLKKEHYEYELLLRLDRFIVSNLNGEDIFFNDSLVGLSENHLKYFCIKCTAPTFDDLIDVICKAFKNGIQIGNVEFVGCGVSFELFHDDIIYKDNQRAISAAINWINSFYTETFTIESCADLNKIDWETATADLSNDRTINLECIRSLDVMDVFNILCGATINQEKQ